MGRPPACSCCGCGFRLYVVANASTVNYLYEYDGDGPLGFSSGVFNTAFAVRTGPRSSLETSKNHDLHVARFARRVEGLFGDVFSERYSFSAGAGAIDNISQAWQDTEAVANLPGDLFLAVNSFGETLFADDDGIFATDADGNRLWSALTAFPSVRSSSGADAFPDGNWCVPDSYKVFEVARADGTLTEIADLTGEFPRSIKTNAAGDVIVLHGKYHRNQLTVSGGTGDPTVTSYTRGGVMNWQFTPTEGTADTLRPFWHEAITVSPDGSVYMTLAKSCYVIDDDLYDPLENPDTYTSVVDDVSKLYKLDGETGAVIWSRFFNDISDPQWFYTVMATEYAVDEVNYKTLQSVCANDQAVFLAFTGSQQTVGGYSQPCAIVRLDPSDGATLASYDWAQNRPLSMAITPGCSG